MINVVIPQLSLGGLFSLAVFFGTAASMEKQNEVVAFGVLLAASASATRRLGLTGLSHDSAQCSEGGFQLGRRINLQTTTNHSVQFD